MSLLLTMKHPIYLEYITEVIDWVDKVVSLPQQSGQCNEQSKVRTQMSGPNYLAVVHYVMYMFVHENSDHTSHTHMMSS